MTENNQNNGQHNEHWLQHLLPFALIAGLVSLLTIVSSQSFGELQPLIPEENWLTKVVSYLIIGTEGAAAFVIGSGVVRALFTYTRHLLDSTNKQINSTERVRLRLGHMLKLTLSFSSPSFCCGSCLTTSSSVKSAPPPSSAAPAITSPRWRNNATPQIIRRHLKKQKGWLTPVRTSLYFLISNYLEIQPARSQLRQIGQQALFEGAFGQ
jgi:hypothetical protein